MLNHHINQMTTAKYALMLAWWLCCWTGIAGQILSRHRPVYMSSQFENWSGDRVVDGNYSTGANDCGCCAATTSQTDPSITIDLENTYLITRIRVFGRTDQDDQDLNSLVFKLDDTNFSPTTDGTQTPILSYNFTLDKPTAARNVTLMLSGSNRILVLCEFDVFNDIVISTNKPINASSKFPEWGKIIGAVDGDTRTDGSACQCCAATDNQENPWLRVDLRGNFYITYIIIYGRTDDNLQEQRFDGLQIEVDNKIIIQVPNTKNYYSSGALREGPATSIELQFVGSVKTLVVCELQVFGECYDDYYGNCSTRCGNCFENQTCNTVDGTCTKCADGYTETDRLCNTVCPNKTYGTNCSKTCGQCKNGTNCNPTDGVCEQCDDGFKETDKTCKALCPGGTYGKNCTDVCGYCRHGLNCSQTNGTCEGCEDGYADTEPTCKTPCPGGTYGYNCTETCGQCRDGVACNKTNGVCEQCKDGFYETDLTCKTLCTNGTYGHNCTGVCGHCKNGAICNKTNGVCDQCEDGFIETDMLCVELCPNGTYGHSCSERCGQCINGESCNQTNGNCGQCESGYTETDTKCKTPCVDFSYGHNCIGVCGHCKNGAICNKTNGVCDQCEDGYMETYMMCVERAENISRPLSSCPICPASPDSSDIMMIVGVTVAAMLAIEGAAVVVICLIRKRNSLRKDNVGEPNPYELPDRSINEDEHQYDSAMDMNVATPNYVNTGRGPFD